MPASDTWVHPRFFSEVRCCSSFLFFVVVLLCVFTFRVPCCDVRYHFLLKRCSIHLYLQLFVGGLMSFFYVICVCFHIMVSNTYCVVFLFCFRLVASFSGFSIYDCPLQYSLTIIMHKHAANARIYIVHWWISLILFTYFEEITLRAHHTCKK